MQSFQIDPREDMDRHSTAYLWRGWVGTITKEVRVDDRGSVLRVGECVTYQCDGLTGFATVSHNNALVSVPKDSVEWSQIALEPVKPEDNPWAYSRLMSHEEARRVFWLTNDFIREHMPRGGEAKLPEYNFSPWRKAYTLQQNSWIAPRYLGQDLVTAIAFLPSGMIFAHLGYLHWQALVYGTAGYLGAQFIGRSFLEIRRRLRVRRASRA